MDLASLNIQRGRDHGLAPYNIWREQCGLRRFSRWEELEDVMDKRTVARLENVYEHVDDIDLFPGGMAEKPVVGGIVGPTFACVLGQQFLNLRKGDRFWYENGDHPGAFTKEQLQVRISNEFILFIQVIVKLKMKLTVIKYSLLMFTNNDLMKKEMFFLTSASSVLS